jgi:hypothetical protein
VLHDAQNIFFCKTDYLLEDFNIISKLDNEVVLISGNSDFNITDEIVSKMPNNIKAWYAQNALANNSKVHPLPIGLENKEASARMNHGIGWGDRVIQKEKAIETIQDSKPTKFIYANFNIDTNLSHRTPIKNLVQNQKHITWKNPNLNLIDFYEDIFDHEMILCPAGNGLDTHRLWEVLYCCRIPITIKTGNYKIYELYKNLPIIILENMEQLLDEQYILDRYRLIKNTNYDKKILNINYWKEVINNAKNK